MTDPTTRYRHTAGMSEISGFGGGYEACCQDMLEAGVQWLVERRESGAEPDLRMSGYVGVFGLLNADSDEAKVIEKVVLAAAKGESTGAMHHAVMSRLGYISKHGWDTYCAELAKRQSEKVA